MTMDEIQLRFNSNKGAPSLRQRVDLLERTLSTLLNELSALQAAPPTSQPANIRRIK